MNNLTEEQREIIEYSGNIVVNAKPGSGKTFTIIEKISNISHELLNFQGIITITYTNKAADELKRRFKTTGLTANNFIGTIHLFCLNEIIIPFSSHITGEHVEFTINNEAIQPEHDIFLLNRVDVTFNQSIDFEERLFNSLVEGVIYLPNIIEMALYILDNAHQCRNYLKSRYKYIIIDEYQDCTGSQHQLFNEIVSLGIGGMAVGDLDQAIFRFNGASPAYIQELISNNDFKLFDLSINHRSHPSISNFALRIINSPYEQINDDNRMIMIKISGAEEQIASTIDDFIEFIYENDNLSGEISNSDFAIICRSGHSQERIAKTLRYPHRIHSSNELEYSDYHFSRFCEKLLLNYYTYKIKTSSITDFLVKFLSKESQPVLFSKAFRLIEQIFKTNEVNLIQEMDTIQELYTLFFNEVPDINSIKEMFIVISNHDKLDTFKPLAKNEVNILTYHKSKGLEFRYVFLLDVYKYIIPRYKSSPEEIEESESLLYVGITRAKEYCFIMQGSYRHNSNDERKLAEPSEILNNQNASSELRVINYLINK